MTTTSLDGLDGTNPLGYLAALGALLVADRMMEDVRLSWTSGFTNVAVIHGIALSDLVRVVMEDCDRWRDSTALGHVDGRNVDDVKFETSDDVRGYLKACAAADDGGRSLALAQALVCEFAFDKGGKTKPSDLHFTAGKQQFLKMARELRDEIGAEDVERALVGPWSRPSTLPSFKWDIADDRVHAVSARKPSTEKKNTEPGAEWLALQGLAFYGVQRAGAERVAVSGGGGSWERGSWRWALWDPPLSAISTMAFVNRIDVAVADVTKADAGLRMAGVTKVLSTTVMRSGKGGYGSFRPTVVLWDKD